MRAQKRKKKEPFIHFVLKHKWLYILMLPGILYMLVFNYLPMLGIVIAFQDFRPFSADTAIGAYLQSEFIGFVNFKKFFTGYDFTMLMKNTLSISLLSLIFYFPAPIILALLLNEIRSQKYKRVAQTFVYIPHFISLVIVATLTQQLFSSSDGIIYKLMEHFMGRGDVPNILASPRYFYGLIVGQNIWKETGYGTIIFLAALAGVDMELYEAARIDGAGRWRLIWHITLPAIRSTIVIMLILRVGSVLNTGYEQIFLMQNDLNYSASEVFDTYIYNKGIKLAQYSLSTAAGVFKSVVSMILVLAANKIAKICGEAGFY
ncbi:ABC transporter permease subunit [Lachnospiraceae bacterium OttesenSCG-928-D06]|nr:ABC transporter permease subunit [Lachnospiraceae bacterium OttesenSCG-928-D06]